MSSRLVRAKKTKRPIEFDDDFKPAKTAKRGARSKQAVRKSTTIVLSPTVTEKEAKPSGSVEVVRIRLSSSQPATLSAEAKSIVPPPVVPPPVVAAQPSATVVASNAPASVAAAVPDLSNPRPLNKQCQTCGTQLTKKMVTAGINQGRDYVVCEKDNCHFKWMNNEPINDVPHCYCQLYSVGRTVKKQGANFGRLFFGCPKYPIGHCAFFEWCPAQLQAALAAQAAAAAAAAAASPAYMAPHTPMPGAPRALAAAAGAAAATSNASLPPASDDANGNECCVCLDKPKAMLFEPCYHLKTCEGGVIIVCCNASNTVCTACALYLTHCPCCRTEIKSKRRVFT